MSKEAKKKSDDDELDLGAISALVRSSVAPPPMSDDGDAKLDLRTLVASVPPPPMPAEHASLTAEESGVQRKSESKPESREGEKGPVPAEREAKPDTESKTTTRPAPASAAPAPSNNGIWIGLGIAVAAVVGGFVFMQSRGNGAGQMDEAIRRGVTESRLEGSRERTATSEAATAGASTTGMAAAVDEPPPSVETDQRSRGSGDQPAELGSDVAEQPPSPTAAIAAALPRVDSTGTDDSPQVGSSAERAVDSRTGAASGAVVQEQSEAPRGSRERPDRPGRGERIATVGGERSASTASAERIESSQSQRTAPTTSDRASSQGADSASGSSDRGATERGERTASSASSSASTPSLDDVVGRALGAGSRAAAPAAAARPSADSADLPDVPTRAEIASVFGRLMPRIRQCAGEQVGMSMATLIVRNDGTVASAAVGGQPFGGTPQGACMEGVLREARFSPFRQSTHRIQQLVRIAPQ